MGTTGSEDGAGTVLGIVLIGLIAAIGGALAVVGGLVVTHRQAQAAADLAALAGAQAHQRGDAGCAAARSIAQANRARLSTCTLGSNGVLMVRVARSTPFGSTYARSCAGPVSLTN